MCRALLSSLRLLVYAIWVSIFGIHFQSLPKTPSTLSVRNRARKRMNERVRRGGGRGEERAVLSERCVNVIRRNIIHKTETHCTDENSTCAFIILQALTTTTPRARAHTQSHSHTPMPMEKATSKRCRLGLRKTKPLKKLIKFLLNLCATAAQPHRRQRSHQKLENGR